MEQEKKSTRNFDLILGGIVVLGLSLIFVGALLGHVWVAIAGAAILGVLGLLMMMTGSKLFGLIVVGVALIATIFSTPPSVLEALAASALPIMLPLFVGVGFLCFLDQ